MKRLIAILLCAAVAVLAVASASRTEAKSIAIRRASGGVIFSSTSSTPSTPSTPTHVHQSRGRTSLVSHWLDSTLGSSDDVNSNRHHQARGNSTHPPGGAKGKGKGKGNKPKNDDDRHKPLLPLNRRDLLGLLAAALAILLASGGGIGGGGLLVPIFLLVFAFGTRDSVALSNITILGGSIVSLFYNLPRRHPRHRDRPLIDWDIILVMEPSTICGAVAGGYLNKITPTWLTTSLLALLLTAMAFKLIKRARSVWKLEGEERRLARLAAEEGQERIPGLSALLLDGGAATGGGEPLLLGQTLSSAPSLPSLVSLADEALAAAAAASPKPPHSRRRKGGGVGNGSSSPSSSPPKPAAAATGGSGGGGGDEERASAPASDGTGDAAAAVVGGGAETPASPFSEHRIAPPRKVALIFALTLFVLAADLSKQLVECGSPLYWLVVASVAPPSLAVALAARARLLREHALRASGAPGWPAYEPGEVVWTRASSVSFPAVSTLAGVVAGFFGVGGGIVKGPLMLEMGVAPEVAAATSITMILFTSSAASVLYLSFGVPLDYAKAVFVTGAVFTALGQSLVARLVKKLGQSAFVVVLLMAAMMAVSASVVFFEAGELTRRAVVGGNLGGHGHIC